MSSENILDDFSREQEDSQLSNDVRLEMKIKNNILWKEIHKKFSSVAAFCKANKGLGITATQVGKLLAFKISPFKYKRIEKTNTHAREYRKLCLALEQVLNCPAEVLFPEELYQKFVGVETSKIIEINSFSALPAPQKQKLLFLPAPDPSPISQAELKELGEKMDVVLNTLPYRQREIIKLRYGLGDGYIYTYDEIAAVFKVTRERIRQIEAGVLRKLRRPARSSRLESFI